MRFSLKTLLVCSLFAALIANAIANHRAHQLATAKNAELEAMIANQRLSLSTTRKETDDQSYQLYVDQSTSRLRHTISEQERLAAELADAFHRAAKDYQIEPRLDKVSVLDRPMIKTPGKRFDKQWDVHIPEDSEIVLKVQFLSQNETALERNPDFSGRDTVVETLSPGPHRVSTFLTRRNEEKPGQLVVQLDGKTLVDCQDQAPESSGHSMTNYEYPKQRDFDRGPLESTGLLRFWRNSGTTIISIGLHSKADGDDD